MELQESAHLVLQNQNLVAGRFYERFFTKYPEVRRYFEGTDMKRQAALLSMALLLVEHHYKNRQQVTENYLKVLGHAHATRRGIPAVLFDAFTECLIETIAAFHGGAWTEHLAKQWREALDLAVGVMKEGYHGNYSV